MLIFRQLNQNTESCYINKRYIQNIAKIGAMTHTLSYIYKGYSKKYSIDGCL